MDAMREPFRQSRLGELSQQEGQLDKLQLRAEAVGYDDDGEHARKMKDLRTKTDDIRESVDTLRGVADDGFQQAAPGIDRAIEDLEESVRAVTSAR